MIPKGKRPRDPNMLAHMIVGLSTGEVQQEPDKRNPAAVELGRKGGLKGGKARASNLSPETRKEQAKNAATARWANRKPAK